VSNSYDLTKPCNNCPFRTDVKPYLRAARVAKLESDLVGGQASFTCHKTTVESEPDEDGESRLVEGPKSQHCAGAMILLEKIGRPNQMMRIAERLRLYAPAKLDLKAPVFDSFDAMKRAQSDYEEEETPEDPCSVVYGGCEAPAGWNDGGVIRYGTDSAEFQCDECGEPVCGPCSSVQKSGRRICGNCAED